MSSTAMSPVIAALDDLHVLAGHVPNEVTRAKIDAAIAKARAAYLSASPVTGEAELRAALSVALHAMWGHPQSAPGMGDDACPSVAERLAALMPGGSSGGIDPTYIQSALGFVDRACARLDNHTYTADATFFGGVRDILDKARMVLNAALSSPAAPTPVTGEAELRMPTYRDLETAVLAVPWWPIFTSPANVDPRTRNLNDWYETFKGLIDALRANALRPVEQRLPGYDRLSPSKQDSVPEPVTEPPFGRDVAWAGPLAGRLQAAMDRAYAGGGAEGPIPRAEKQRGPTGVRCLLGFHDWDRFGRCSRCWRVRGISDIVEAILPGISTRTYHGHVEDAGRALQSELRALGTNATLELCKDAERSGFAVSLIELARSRREDRDDGN